MSKHPQATMSTQRETDLHAAVCHAVAILNRSPEVVLIAEVREVRDTLQQALIDYADAFMDQPTSEGEQAHHAPFAREEGSMNTTSTHPQAAEGARQWLTLEQIQAEYASHDYSAELLLQHALHLLAALPAAQGQAADPVPAAHTPLSRDAMHDLIRRHGTTYDACRAVETAASARIAQLDARITELRAHLDAALDAVIDLGGEVRLPEIEDAKRLRADARRYQWLLEWLQCNSLLCVQWCKPNAVSAVGNYWVLRSPYMVDGNGCAGYGKTEDDAIDSAIAGADGERHADQA